jgi:hypothetical protein
MQIRQTIDVPDVMFYYLLGSFLLNESRGQGYDVHPRDEELFKVFLGFIMMWDYIKENPTMGKSADATPDDTTN